MVISPQSEWKKTRKFICDLGYYIKDEVIIEENKKFYLIIKFVKGNKKYNDEEFEYGPLLLKNKSKEFIKYFELILKEKRKVLKKVPIFKIKDRLNSRKQIKSLKRILKNE